MEKERKPFCSCKEVHQKIGELCVYVCVEGDGYKFVYIFVCGSVGVFRCFEYVFFFFRCMLLSVICIVWLTYFLLHFRAWFAQNRPTTKFSHGKWKQRRQRKEHHWQWPMNLWWWPIYGFPFWKRNERRCSIPVESTNRSQWTRHSPPNWRRCRCVCWLVCSECILDLF